METTFISIITLITALAAIIEATVVLVAIWPAYKQLREAVKVRSLEAFKIIAEDIQNIIEERRLIYSELVELPSMTKKVQKDFISQLKEDSKNKIIKACYTFDKMGVFVTHGLVPKEVAFSIYFDVVLRIWHLVEPFIKEEREKRKNDIWMMYFEKLNELCWNYWLKLLEDHPGWKYFKTPNDIFRYVDTHKLEKRIENV